MANEVQFPINKDFIKYQEDLIKVYPKLHFEGDLSSAILSDKDPSDTRYEFNKFILQKR